MLVGPPEIVQFDYIFNLQYCFFCNYPNDDVIYVPRKLLSTEALLQRIDYYFVMRSY